jgi:hypothetical protein
MRIRSFSACIAVALTTLALAGCNPKEPGQPNPPTPQTSGAIPQGQLDAMDKAKNVEGVMEQGAQRSEPPAQ